MEEEREWYENNGSISRNADGPGIRIDAIMLEELEVKIVNVDKKNDKSLDHALKEPEEIVFIVEDKVFLSKEIEFREIAFDFMGANDKRVLIISSILKIMNILVQNGSDGQRQRSEEQIKEGNVPSIIKRLTAEIVIESKIKLSHGEDHVFIKEIEDHFADSHIGPFSVNEQEFS